MADTVFKLDESKRWFVELARIDPMTRESFAMGDDVIICRSCKIVHKDYTWRDNGGCCAPGCHSKVSAKSFLTPPSGVTPPPRIAVRAPARPAEPRPRMQVLARTGADGVRVEVNSAHASSPAAAPRRTRSRTVTPPPASEGGRIVLGNAAREERTPIVIRSRHEGDD